jgi:hypothetical protein
MAVRRATRKYDDILSFLRDYEATLKDGGVFLPAGTLKGELSNEVRLDFVLPIVGRAGPVKAQVVHRSPEGVALLIPSMSTEVQALFDKFFAMVVGIRDHFIQSGEVVLRADHEAQVLALQQEKDVAVARAVALTNQQQQQQHVANEGAETSSAAAPEPASPAQDSDAPLSRGFKIPNLPSLKLVKSGALSGDSFRNMLLELALHSMRALMVVEHPDGPVRYGFWDRGGPVGWRTEPVQEGEVLGVLLYRSEQISREQLQESLRFMEQQNCRQGEAFIEMGLMSFPQLVMVLGKQVDFVLQQALTASAGKWSLYGLEELPEQFLPPPLRVPSLLFRSLSVHARTLSMSEVRRTQTDKLNRYVSLTESAKKIITDIKMTSSELKFVEIMMSNSWRFRELFTVSPMSRGQTGAFLWAMDELGFMNYATNEDIARKLSRLTKRIRSKKRHISRGTKFDILEIHWICLPQDIEKAYKRVHDEFDVTKISIPLPAELRKDAEEILTHINESHEFLKDASQRRAYRKTLIEPMMIRQSADLLSKQGEMAIMRRDRRAACGCFTKALELMPKSSLYKAGLKRSTAIM